MEQKYTQITKLLLEQNGWVRAAFLSDHMGVSVRTMQEINSCMYILINDVPIEWGETSVQLVIMLCFSPADRQLFNTIFDPLAITLLNRSTVKELLTIRTPEEFLDVLVNSRK